MRVYCLDCGAENKLPVVEDRENWVCPDCHHIWETTADGTTMRPLMTGCGTAHETGGAKIGEWTKDLM